MERELKVRGTVCQKRERGREGERESTLARKPVERNTRKKCNKSFDVWILALADPCLVHIVNGNRHLMHQT